MNEWNIQSRAHACTACGKSFADKELFHTLLFDDKAEFRRSDVCHACWEKQYSEGARDRRGFISYWQGIFQAPAPPTDPIRRETAESLLRKLIELDDPKYVPAGYILAAMLERKRVLKVKEQLVRDGHRLFVYEQGSTGDVFTILDPNLQLNQLEAVQRDVAELLEHGLVVPGASPVPPAPGDPPVSPATSEGVSPGASGPASAAPPAPPVAS